MRPPGHSGSLPLAGASTRSRAERRQLLAAWGERVVKRLRRLGLHVDSCEVDESRAAFQPDGRLGLTLASGRIEVALELPPSHLGAPRAMLADPVRGLELTAALEALPEQFAIGALGDALLLPASRARADDLRALLDRVEREGRDLWLGWSVPRDVATAHADILDEQLADAIVALGEVLELLAVAPQPAPTAPHKPRHDHASRGRGDEDPARRHRAKSRPRDRDHERDGEPEVEPESTHLREPASRAPRAQAAPMARPPLRTGRLRRSGPAVDARVPIDAGARVRVLEGPFVGKMGVVQELDGRGGARVMLGLLAVRIDVKDLASSGEGGGRPRLSSSHRKPIPVRS